MSKIEEMRKILSPSALAVLETLGSDNAGYVVDVHPIHQRALGEFRMHGVVGPKDGLTEIGALLAGQLQAEYMDRMF